MSVKGGDEAGSGRTVMHVVDNFYPTVGGLERAVASLCARWRELGVRPVVVTGWRDGLAERELVDGVEVFRVRSSFHSLPGVGRDTGRVFFPPVRDVFAERAVSRVVSEVEPDLVHGHGWMLDAVSGAFSKVPVVAGWHDFSAGCAVKSRTLPDGSACAGPSLAACLPCASDRYGPLRSAAVVPALAWTARRRPARFDAQVCVSPVVESAVSSLRRPAGGHGRVGVVPTFVSDDVLSAARRADRPSFVPASEGYVAFAGQLSASKGVGLLLSAHERMVEQGFRVPLVVMGLTAHAESAALSRAAAASDLVTVVSDVSHEEVLGAFRYASLGVVPSAQDAFGQVALEMLAAGCPAVVVEGTGPAWVVEDGVSGVHVPYDVEALCAAMVALVSDEGMRCGMAASAPDRAALFTLGRTVPKLIAVYDELLGESFLP